jgi:hypothetical protein
LHALPVIFHSNCLASVTHVKSPMRTQRNKHLITRITYFVFVFSSMLTRDLYCCRVGTKLWKMNGNTVELGYDVMTWEGLNILCRYKRVQCYGFVNIEELIGTTEYLTL